MFKEVKDRNSAGHVETAHQFDKWSAGVDSFHDYRQSSCF